MKGTYKIQFYEAELGIEVFIQKGEEFENMMLDEFMKKYDELVLMMFTKIKKEYPDIYKNYQSSPIREQRELVLKNFIKKYFAGLTNTFDIEAIFYGDGDSSLKFNLEKPYVKGGVKKIKDDDTYILY